MMMGDSLTTMMGDTSPMVTTTQIVQLDDNGGYSADNDAYNDNNGDSYGCVDNDPSPPQQVTNNAGDKQQNAAAAASSKDTDNNNDKYYIACLLPCSCICWSCLPYKSP